MPLTQGVRPAVHVDHVAPGHATVWIDGHAVDALDARLQRKGGVVVMTVHLLASQVTERRLY